jgi:molybdate transport system ATP-binding protein
MQNPLVKFENATFRKFQYTVFPNTCWEMHPGENWAVTGNNGSGKTTFLEAIEGRLIRTEGHVHYCLDATDNKPYRQIAPVYFSDRDVQYGDFYYQQRYHATETDGIITVRNFLNITDEHLPEPDIPGIRQLLDLEIIKLSNGQFKKMLIAKALLKKPKLLLLDNLYTGLDSEARAYISTMLEHIVGLGTNIIMVTDGSCIPEVITHLMEISRFTINRTLLRNDYAAPVFPQGEYPKLPELPPAPAEKFDKAVHLDRVSITYSGKTVIDRAEWTIHHGEKWALTGPNGSGKTMLLSLIFADNPQAYANKITLFDRKRGTGESIWDIKDMIGFVSPEMHIYFRKDRTCQDVALSGLYENPYGKPEVTDAVLNFTDGLFAYFSISSLQGELFQKVSTGRQNMILLIRALVKNPPMLVLDEPFQGMDVSAVHIAGYLLDAFCRNRTLIFVSHHPEELPSCINNRLHIENGKVVCGF